MLLTCALHMQVLKGGGLGEPAQRGFLGLGGTERARQYCELRRGGSRGGGSSTGGVRQGVLAEVRARHERAHAGVQARHERAYRGAHGVASREVGRSCLHRRARHGCI